MFGQDDNQQENGGFVGSTGTAPSQQTDQSPVLQPPINSAPPLVTPADMGDDPATGAIPNFGQPFAPVTDTAMAMPGGAGPQVPAVDDGPMASPTVAAPEDLVGIKQEALEQLSPLVEHLDQTPEEKFKTTMMMIQASDDQSLVKPAFETAKQITDDKARAQAFLDIINEINYFTQHQN